MARRQQWLLAVALCGFVAAQAQASSSVLLIDSRSNGYLQQQQQAAVSQAQLQGVVAAMTGLQPAARVDASAAQQIASLVKASPLVKPQAHVSLTVAGLTDEDLASLFAGRTKVSASLQQVDSAADAVAEVLADLAEANPEVAVQLLERVAAQRCGNQQAGCVSELVPAVASALEGVDFNVDSQTLTLADGTQLDLQELADKAFVMELASAVVGVQELLQSRGQAPQDLLVMDLTMVALQGMTAKYGKGSAEEVASKQALLSVLQWALQSVDQHFDGDVTAQVAHMADGSVADAQAWKSWRHARLLQATTTGTSSNSATPAWLQGDEAALAKRFASKAAGFGAFIIMLYFLLLGIYCLCTMPMVRDTMLFGAKKTD